MITLTLQHGRTLTIEHVHLDAPSTTIVLGDDRGSLGGCDATKTHTLATALTHHHDAHVHDTESVPLTEASGRDDAATSTLHGEVHVHTELVLLTRQDGQPLAAAVPQTATLPARDP